MFVEFSKPSNLLFVAAVALSILASLSFIQPALVSMTYDIGRDTTELFKARIRQANLVVFNGPLGMYENLEFTIGTKKVLETLAFTKKCFSILGGGDTERALQVLGLLHEDFSHVSLAGKALLQFLSGNHLPGLEALKQFNHRKKPAGS